MSIQPFKDASMVIWMLTNLSAVLMQNPIDVNFSVKCAIRSDRDSRNVDFMILRETKDYAFF